MAARRALVQSSRRALANKDSHDRIGLGMNPPASALSADAAAAARVSSAAPLAPSEPPAASPAQDASPLTTDGALTPMWRQYRRLKAAHPDALLLFRLGDFYELFGGDAEIAARELELVLTGREMGKGHRVPMCGVPHHAAERYLARLLGKGYRVAVCDQMADPAATKGLVPRQVTRVYSPGTVVEDFLLDAQSNNFLAAVAAGADGLGLAVVDSSTGEFRVTEVSGDGWRERAAEELARWRPAEVITTDAGWSDWAREASEAPARAWAVDAFEPADEVLCKHFGVATVAGFGLTVRPLALEAARLALDYLRAHQQSALEHVRSISVFETSEFVTLDPVTRRNLELTATLRDHSRVGSVLAVIDRTRTAMGARRMRQWLLAPLRDRAAIESRLDAVEAFHRHAMLREAVRAALDDIYDIERLVARCAAAAALPRDLMALRRSLEALPGLRAVLAAAPDAVQQRGDGLDDCADLRDLLARALVDDPPPTLRDGGVIRDGCDAELDRLRSAGRDGRGWIAALEVEQRERTGVRSLKVGFNQVFGYYLEVTKPNLDRVPADYERKQTLANAERYTTPELRAVEEQVRGADERALALEFRLFADLRGAVCREAARLQRVAQTLAELDALAGLAEAAARHDYVRPRLCDAPRIAVRAGRHPVVERRAESFVPNDTLLDGDAQQVIILTGPNMAGKSTYLRQTALIVLLAQLGSFVPADDAEIGLVDRVFTRVGASDDLAAGQSTFLVEMTETANILHNATERSLVLLDEVGRGTSTYDGMSLAWAVAEALHDTVGCLTLFATHYHQLNALAEALPRVRNFRAAVREEGNQVVFLHRIVAGGTDRSYGLQVARLAGIPPAVIERAKQVLAALERDGAAPGAPLSAQLSLLDPRSPNASAASEAAAPAAPHPVVRELAALDPDRMTPLEALTALARLREQVRE